jgi:hypothetical protein
MDLQQYLTETEKQYHLRLKTIVPIDDSVMDKIENYLAKYKPLDVSRPKKTILQREPLDFPNVAAAEVYIVDMTFGLPAAPHVLRADLRKLLDAPENYVFVRTRNEPGEIETERLNALADIELEAAKRGLKPASLLDDPDYSEAEHAHPDMYGTDYNAALLDFLATVEGERHEQVERVQNAPFKWLALTDNSNNYNKDVADAPFVTWKTKSTPDVSQHLMGSIDQSRGTIRRVYLDGNGKKVVLTRKLAAGEK